MRDGRALFQTQNAGDAAQRGVDGIVWVNRQHFVCTQSAIRVLRNDVGKRAPTVNKEPPAGQYAIRGVDVRLIHDRRSGVEQPDHCTVATIRTRRSVDDSERHKVCVGTAPLRCAVDVPGRGHRLFRSCQYFRCVDLDERTTRLDADHQRRRAVRFLCRLSVIYVHWWLVSHTLRWQAHSWHRRSVVVRFHVVNTVGSGHFVTDVNRRPHWHGNRRSGLVSGGIRNGGALVAPR